MPPFFFSPTDFASVVDFVTFVEFVPELAGFETADPGALGGFAFVGSIVTFFAAVGCVPVDVVVFFAVFFFFVAVLDGDDDVAFADEEGTAVELALVVELCVDFADEEDTQVELAFVVELWVDVFFLRDELEGSVAATASPLSFILATCAAGSFSSEPDPSSTAVSSSLIIRSPSPRSLRTERSISHLHAHARGSRQYILSLTPSSNPFSRLSFMLLVRPRIRFFNSL